MSAHEWQRQMRESTDADLDDRLTRIALAIDGLEKRKAYLEDEAALIQMELARRTGYQERRAPA